MKLEDVLKQLEKEKDQLKYLKETLKKINDNKLKKEIEKLISDLEKKSSSKKEKPSTLESAVEHIPSSRPREVPTETFEPYSPSRFRERVSITFPTRQEENNQNESYGSSIKTDYIRNVAEFKQSLETSGLISRSGFNTTAESQEAARQKDPNKDYNLNSREEMFSYHSERDERMKEDLSGLPSDLREMHKKRKNIGVYHG